MKRWILFIISSTLVSLVVIALFMRSSQNSYAPSVTSVVNTIPYTIRVELPSEIIVGGDTPVRIRVEKDGKPFDGEAEGRLVHVMIVSANLRDTFHTFSPTREKAGVYIVQHTFTQAGKYRIWIEVDDTNAKNRHDQNAEYIAYAEASVGGSSLPASSLVESSETTIGSYRVQLANARIEAGKPTTLRVAVTDLSGKKVPLFDHEPFLYFMSGENFSFFRHGHGVTLSDGTAGLENTFPVAGKYVWWLQLHVVSDEAVTGVQVPFLIEVQ